MVEKYSNRMSSDQWQELVDCKQTLENDLLKEELVLSDLINKAGNNYLTNKDVAKQKEKVRNIREIFFFFKYAVDGE